MFRRIRARNYRCLREIDQQLNGFEILVGSNGSGKSTFLDVISFLGTMVSEGLQSAVERRTANFSDLVWGRDAESFELGVEVKIPESLRSELRTGGVADSIQYDVRIRLDTISEKLEIVAEEVVVYGSGNETGEATVVRSNALHFVNETERRSYVRAVPNRNYSSLNSLPVDSEFPATAWLRELLRERVRLVALDPAELRKPSPPSATESSQSRGGYLARSVSLLRSERRSEYDAWLAHIRTVLPDVKTIDTVVRENDRHRFLMITYENGVSVPSWMASDGTLRLLALTLLAYLPSSGDVYLVEEPENGVHPAALEAIFQSLSSVYDGQVLMTSHSPVLLGAAAPDQLLCFSKTPEGTVVVRGTEHKALRDWKGEVSLGILAASGILG